MAICIEGVEQFDYRFSSGGCFPLKFVSNTVRREGQIQSWDCALENVTLSIVVKGDPRRRSFRVGARGKIRGVIRAEESDPEPVSLLCNHSP